MTRDDWNRLLQGLLPLCIVAQWLPQALDPSRSIGGSVIPIMTWCAGLLLAFAVVRAAVRFGRPDPLLRTASGRLILRDVALVLLAVTLGVLGYLAAPTVGPGLTALRFGAALAVIGVVIGFRACHRDAPDPAAPSS